VESVVCFVPDRTSALSHERVDTFISDFGARTSDLASALIRGQFLANMLLFATFMKITEALLAEHVVFHNLFDFVERTLPTIKTLAEVQLLAALLQAVLRTHTKVEDHLLIDPLESTFSQMGQDETFHEEHEEIEHDLESVGAAKRVGEAKRRLLKAAVLCRKHFDKEERIVFPMAERQFSPKSLLVLGKRWEEQRTVPIW
jgi:hemerythrin-like domain-containing protein